MPPAFPNYAPLQTCRDNVVTILEHVRFNHQILSNDPFDRVASAVNKRLEILDYDGRKGPKHGPSSTEIPEGGKRKYFPERSKAYNEK
jgi:hypothetical protein